MRMIFLLQQGKEDPPGHLSQSHQLRPLLDDLAHDDIISEVKDKPPTVNVNTRRIVEDVQNSQSLQVELLRCSSSEKGKERSVVLESDTSR